MKNTDYIKLIIKYLSGTIDPAERKILDRWLKSAEENRKTLVLIEQIWNTEERGLDKPDLKAAWSKLTERAGISLPFEEARTTNIRSYSPSFKTRTKFGYQIMRYAAILLIVFSLAYIFSKEKLGSQSDGQQEIIVQYGKQNKLTLPDGSKITLDAGSKLSFPEDFSGNFREVYLYGEAYFEVVHNPQKPFIIHANQAIIKVLGTKFNVRAWRLNDDEVEVVVVEGKVSLGTKNESEKTAVIVDKGKMSYLSKKHPQPSSPKKVNTEKYLAWINRDLILENTPLYDVLDRLSRWYNLKFKLPDPVYNNVMITGIFKNKSIDYILDTICLMTQLDYKRNGDKVVFYRKRGL